MKENLFGKNIAELQALFVPLGVQKFRAKQVAQWMYEKGARSFRPVAVRLAGRDDVSHRIFPVDRHERRAQRVLRRVQRNRERHGQAFDEMGVGLTDAERTAAAKLAGLPIEKAPAQTITEPAGTAAGGEVTFLRRERFGPLVLDETLEEGGWRELYEDEIAQIREITRKTHG